MIYLILFLSGTMAWTISTAASGGAATLLIPIIRFLLSAQLVPPIISITSILANPSREFFFYQYIDWKVIRYLMPGSLLGEILGAWSFTQINVELIQIILGVFLLTYVFQYQFSKTRFHFQMKRPWFFPLGMTGGGTLILSNPVALGAATLTLTNSGTLDASTLTTTLTGNFVMDAGATFKTTLNSDTANDSGTLLITGDANVDAGSFVFINAGTLTTITAGQTFVVLDAATGSGDLGAGLLPTIDGTALFDFTGSTDNTNIVVTVNVSTVFTSLLASSPNATALFNSGALTNLFAADAAFGTALSSISDPAEYIAALESLITDSSGALVFSSMQLQHLAVGTVLSRFDDLRDLASNDGRLSGLAAGDTYTVGGVGIWMQGFANTADQDDRDGFLGYDQDAYGVALGADTLLTKDMRVGAAFTYVNADVDTNSVSNTLDIDSYQGSLYASYNPGEWFFDGVVTYASNDYVSRRAVLTGVTARGDFDADQWGIRGRFGRTWDYQGVDLTPYVSLNYINLDIDAYTETGAGAANLVIRDQDYDLLESSLGISVSKMFETAKGTSFVPEAHVAWLHDFSDDNQAVTSTFAAGGASFSTTGLDPSDDTFNVGASLAIYNTGNLDVQVGYDFQTKDDYDSHSGQLTLRYSFY